jgi:hypothetical protein
VLFCSKDVKAYMTPVRSSTDTNRPEA